MADQPQPLPSPSPQKPVGVRNPNQPGMVTLVRPPRGIPPPPHPPDNTPVTWADFHNLYARVMEALELIHQVNYFGFVLSETLIEKGVITRADLTTVQARLQKTASELVTKINELRSAPVSQKEKVYAAIPYRLRPDDLSIPVSEFFKHLRSYIKEHDTSLTMAELMDIVMFYGLPRTVYERLLKERDEFFIPGRSDNPPMSNSENSHA